MTALTEKLGTDTAALAAAVSANTPAAKIGLQAGDVVTAVDGKAITSVADLSAALKGHKAGDKVSVTWTHDGSIKKATATLIAGPAN